MIDADLTGLHSRLEIVREQPGLLAGNAALDARVVAVRGEERVVEGDVEPQEVVGNRVPRLALELDVGLRRKVLGHA